MAQAAWALVLSAALPAASLAAAAPDSASGPHAPREGFVSRRDAARALFAAAAVALVSRGDAHFTDEASRPQTSLARNLAHAGEHVGDLVYAGPVLAGLWIVGRAEGEPRLSASALRIAGGAAAGFVAAGGLKLPVGRYRPRESPDDPYRYRAFSDHLSFPSVHTACAFALAAGADAETRARWVPFVAYPLAGLTAWSRVHDREHWASDVTAGAIVGLWAEHKFRIVAAPRGTPGGAEEPRPGLRLGLGAPPGSSAIGPVIRVGF